MTTTEKNATISAAILAFRAAGLSVRDAVNTVLGEGTFERLAGEVYDELRAMGNE